MSVSLFLLSLLRLLALHSFCTPKMKNQTCSQCRGTKKGKPLSQAPTMAKTVDLLRLFCHLPYQTIGKATSTFEMGRLMLHLCNKKQATSNASSLHTLETAEFIPSRHHNLANKNLNIQEVNAYRVCPSFRTKGKTHQTLNFVSLCDRNSSLQIFLSIIEGGVCKEYLPTKT